MNALVWTTFALVVVVAPTLAVGTGKVLAWARPAGPARPARRSPIQLEGVRAFVEAPVVVAEPEVVAARSQIFVQPRPGGRWAVQKAGAQRAMRVFDDKQDAVDRAAALAARENAELVVAA